MFTRRHPYLFFLLIFCSIGTLAIVTLSGMALWASRGGRLEFGERVGVIEVSGVITDSRFVVESLARFRKDDGIKAIVVRIDSPGGAVGPAQEIFREIEKTVGTKRVIASMGSVAASGGYYVAVGADGIVANPGTITGSIGAVMGFTNFQGLIEKIGLRPVVIKSGEYKDLASPVREMTAGEKAILQECIDTIHSQFVSAVAHGRKLPLNKVEPIADGRIFTGEQAKEWGLADRLGNLDDAIQWAAELGGITGTVVTEYARRKDFSILQHLMGSWFSNILHSTVAGPFFGYLYRPSTTG